MGEKSHPLGKSIIKCAIVISELPVRAYRIRPALRLPSRREKHPAALSVLLRLLPSPSAVHYTLVHVVLAGARAVGEGGGICDMRIIH